MSITQEFRDFAVKGNVVDMAVGIIIGAAFGAIVKILVDGVLMPPLGLLVGNVNFSQLFLDLSGQGYTTLNEAIAAGAPVIKYGEFLQAVIDFTIVAFAVFILVKGINTARRKQALKPSAPALISEDILLLREIRDALKK